jgi:hypothetical protein
MFIFIARERPIRLAQGDDGLKGPCGLSNDDAALAWYVNAHPLRRLRSN